jgi:arginine utilization regulatory protein
MAKHQANSNKDVYPFLASVEKQLLDYDWPGNVRMLENVIVRSLLLQKRRVR